MNTVESEARRQVAAVQERLIADAAVEVTARFVTLDNGPRLQILEAGEGEPLVLLHGSGNSAVAMLPLMEQVHGRRVIAVDRPGYGLSEPTNGLREQPRRTGVSVVLGLLDALGLDRADLVGNSTGGSGRCGQPSTGPSGSGASSWSVPRRCSQAPGHPSHFDS